MGDAETTATGCMEILDSLSVGVLALDRQNRIAFINQALGRLLGIERDAWTGRPALELAGAFRSHLSSSEQVPLALGGTENAVETSSQDLEWKEGERLVHLREESGPWHGASGQVVGRLFTYEDISREKEIDRMKSEFIAVASHELRTPMTSIKGSVDLILSGFAGEISAETQELLEIAQKSCDRLIRLINDILDLAKIEAGQIKLKLVVMDLSEAVERAMRSVRSLAAQNEITLNLSRPEVLPMVEVDKDRIEQVVTNLLSNAIKFSPAKGEVRVELSVGDGWVECAVGDQGCGIAPEDLGRVFGKFQQVGDSRRMGGTGLGLAITQALVHEHRGKLWVESKVNEGSRFIFRLPVASSQTAT